METAKVDIRRLQVLNDRINQCIEALNQVRISVHGLSHSGIAQNLPYQNVPYQNVPFGFNPLTQAQGFSPVTPGLGHTGLLGVAPGMFPQSIPSAVPFAAPGFSPFFGLSHSGAESFESYSRPLWADPYLAARIAQTFPYAYQGISPVVTI